MDESADETLVEWRTWGEAAFAEARERGAPVLLSLSAPWCEWCHRMDRETYANPQIAAHLSDGFLPVRVDVDRHPRVRERYNMGGFPSTVFLTPDGEIINGATYLGPQGFRQVLDTVRKTWDAKGSEAGRVPRALQDPDPPAGEVTADIEAHMVEQVAASFDAEFGGWGTEAKFPLPRTIEFALKRDRERATRTLEAVQTHLYDTYDGGFYRYAMGRDWSDPHREKLTDENAALLRAFATGYLYTGTDSYRKTAEGTVEYLTTDLWTGEAVAGSQAGGDYYALEATEREDRAAPHIDRVAFADRNGLVADALLRFAAVTDHDGAARYAERALASVTADLLKGGRVRHFAGSEAVGLLADQARVLAGLTTAAQVLGEGYLDDARAVADSTIEHLRAPEGAFYDGPREGPGMLDRPLRPIDTNVELADALIDLAALTGQAAYREAAHDALGAFAGASERMGVEVAAYAAACTRDVYDPLVVRTPPAGSDLHRAALRVADHEKVVVPEERDDALVVRSGAETPAQDPDALLDAVAN
jgi:uncharacterized protein YyaL (SSP411 family)